MYLRGSKLNMRRKRRSHSNPFVVLLLALMVGGAVYVNQIVVPETPPLFIPTPTATRNPESFVIEAENLFATGKLTQSIAAYEQAIRSDPNNAAIYVALARVQVFAAKYHDAQINAENALILNPNNPMAYAVLGWALGFEGDYLKAESSIKKSLELDANNPLVHAYYAEVIGKQIEAGQGALGSMDKAAEESRTAIALAPNLLETRRARGYILELTGNYQEALVEYQAAAQYNDNIADIHMALGRNYRFLEQYDKAVEEFTRANALNPTDPLPNTYISRTYATVGEYAKAIQYAEQAVKVDPRDPYLYGNLGTMYYRNRKYEEAADALRYAIRGGTTPDGVEVSGLPLDYGRVAEYYYIYGLTLARLGNCSEALPLSQVIMKGVKDDETAVFNAQEMVRICKEGLLTPTPAPTQEESGEQTETPVEGETEEPVEVPVDEATETPAP
jgi:tetratricopeptide (TPR) repeat protein